MSPLADLSPSRSGFRWTTLTKRPSTTIKPASTRFPRSSARTHLHDLGTSFGSSKHFISVSPQTGIYICSGWEWSPHVRVKAWVVQRSLRNCSALTLKDCLATWRHFSRATSRCILSTAFRSWLRRSSRRVVYALGSFCADLGEAHRASRRMVAEMYKRARWAAARSFGLPLSTFPEDCPWDIRPNLDEE